jgi:hypothetical protein
LHHALIKLKKRHLPQKQGKTYQKAGLGRERQLQHETLAMWSNVARNGMKAADGWRKYYRLFHELMSI